MRERRLQGLRSCSVRYKFNSQIEGEAEMKVSDVMTRDVMIANPQESIQQAAKAMAGFDTGALPVGESGRLVGMITDRDIAIRGIGQGKGPHAKIRDVMSQEIKYCFADQDVEEVTQDMADIQVRRLPVLDRDKRMVGILSLGDIAMKSDNGAAADALSGISRPGGAHNQVA
jgi:CBS domain-containing protein